MSAVFADTFFFVAGLNPSDEAHASALAFSAKHKDAIATTAWVLAEVTNTFRKPPERQGAIRFLRELPSDPRVRIIPASQAHFERGTELFSQRLDKEWSLTDCISFIVMREEGIKEALTGDRHFEQAGFIALLK
jgi:predicted nucleic acid-binding protein